MSSPSLLQDSALYLYVHLQHSYSCMYMQIHGYVYAYVRTRVFHFCIYTFFAHVLMYGMSRVVFEV